MPFLLSEGWGYQFSQLVIFVSTDEEQQQLLDQLKNMYDSKGRNCGIEYNMSLIPAIRVLSLETLSKANINKDYVRIEDVPSLQVNVRTRLAVSESILSLVSEVVKDAAIVHDRAIDVFLNNNPGYSTPQFNWGSAGVYTKGNTEVTQALFDLNVASTYADGKYMFHIGRSILNDIDLENIGAQAAAVYLSDRLGQQFYVYEIPD